MQIAVNNAEWDGATSSVMNTVTARWAGTVVINDNPIVRECLHRALASAGDKVSSYASVRAWFDATQGTPPPAVVLLYIGSRGMSDGSVAQDIALLAGVPKPSSVVVMGDIDRTDQIVAALDAGAKGYVPTNLPLDVAVEALNLVRAGGVFVPASCLIPALRLGGDVRRPAKEKHAGLFTTRQAAVIKALRQGKANKLIAYELNMRESTVKVHVRNVMRKLNARNRTEVAYRTNGMFSDDR